MALKSPEQYSTQTELTKVIRDLINTIGICSSLKEEHPYTYIFFNELFQRHPEKDKKRVDDIIDIRIDSYPKGGYVFNILLDDGTSDTISWKCCVTGKSDSYNYKLTKAYRVTIDDQITEFRNNHRNICEICNSDKKLSVDHINHFAKLIYDFNKINSNSPIELGKNNIQQHCFRPEDADYKNAWAKYHKDNAKLRILCMPCNLARKKWNPPTNIDEDGWTIVK